MKNCPFICFFCNFLHNNRVEYSEVVFYDERQIQKDDEPVMGGKGL